MGAPRKTLVTLLREGTFLARRHEDRLQAETLPVTPPGWADEDAWQALRDNQDAYRTSTNARERRQISLAIQHAQPLLHRARRQALDRILSELTPTDIPIVPLPAPVPDTDLQELRIRFGDRLRHEREQAGLTQRELDYLCGFSHGTTSALERAARTATLPTIHTLAQALNLKPSRLLDNL